MIFLRRLRTQVSLLTLAVLSAGILTVTLAGARTLIQDKRDYLMDLTSRAAPYIGSAMARHFDELQSQFAVFTRILSAAQAGKSSEGLLQAASKKLRGVKSFAIFDSGGLLASSGAPSTIARFTVEERKRIEDRILRSGAARIMIRWESAAALAFTQEDRFYLVELDPGSLAGFFEIASALDVSVSGGDDEVFVSSRRSSRGDISPQAIRSAWKPFESNAKQSVIVQELREPSGSEILIAASPVPDTGNALIVVQARSAEALRLALAILRGSLGGLFLIVLAAVVVSVLFSRRLARPIEDLAEATRHVARGNWDYPVDPQRRFRGRSDEVGHLVQSFTQMTEELSAREVALKKAQEDLIRSEKLAALGTFSAGIAHEIKNPLNSILGFTQLLQRGLSGKIDEKLSGYFSIIVDETRRASGIVTDLLTFARQKAPVLSELSAEVLLDDVTKLLLPQSQDRRVEFRKEIHEPGLRIHADRDQMIQVLGNLASNAMDAMEGKEGERTISFVARKEEGEAVLEVIDTGSGISEENLKRLFEPFFSTKKSGKGTGLGLALCHGIVLRHGGKIRVSSKPGEGTRFEILLPLTRTEASAPASV